MTALVEPEDNGLTDGAHRLSVLTGELRAELNAAYSDPEKYREFIVKMLREHVESINEAIETVNKRSPLEERYVAYMGMLHPGQTLDPDHERKELLKTAVDGLKEILDEVVAKISEFHP